MKFSATLFAVVALAATTVTAAPDDIEVEAISRRYADPVARLRYGFCGAPGVSCGKLRRAAEAVAEAIALPKHRHPGYGFCGAPGISCGKVRRHVEEIGDTLDDVVKRDARLRYGFCGAPGISCGRDAVAEADAWRKFGFCGAPGISCGRNAAPEAKAHIKKFGFCGAPGISCGKMKRAVEAINDADPEHFRKVCHEEGGECHAVLKAKAAFEQVKREAAAAASAEPRHKKLKYGYGFCGAPGISCGRDVHDYFQAAERGDENAKQVETDCFGPDGECTKADEDFAKLERSINDAVESLDDI